MVLYRLQCEDITLQRELALFCRLCSLAKKSSSKGTLTGFASTKKTERSGKGWGKNPSRSTARGHTNVAVVPKIHLGMGDQAKKGNGTRWVEQCMREGYFFFSVWRVSSLSPYIYWMANICHFCSRSLALPLNGFISLAVETEGGRGKHLPPQFSCFVFLVWGERKGRKTSPQKRRRRGAPT